MQLTAERTARMNTNREIVEMAIADLTAPAAPRDSRTLTSNLDPQARCFGLRGDITTIRGALPADRDLFAAFSQPHLEVERMDEVGDRVVTHISFTGRHMRRYRGVAATGRDMQARGVIVHELREGHVIDAWSVLHWR